MKASIKSALVIVLFAIGIFSVPLVRAHEILPEDVLKLIRENPAITAEQIDAYLKANEHNATSSSSSQSITTVLGVKDPNASVGTVIIEFIKLGILHILSGVDHILFVLALLLVFVNLKTTLKLVTAFTIAHSITLILAGSGFFSLSSRVVEPLIAFSIAYMAITTVFLDPLQNTKKKLSAFWIVFFFGLFHGLGFAGLLKDFAVPEKHFLPALLFFNVGIEIGQALIIVTVLPYIYLLRNKVWYPTAVKICAVVISQIALVWFFERLFDFKVFEFLASV